ncbi:unnamed protein product [Cylindrotheca closterium]|uniref:Uncharacterized protein n=1 Tax=Cylindrotheca closterium TaxID=2856 RepID=A0AAD2CVM6_9STRA|nr:unnamed protein product [Cylindrotheca closterium]
MDVFSNTRDQPCDRKWSAKTNVIRILLALTVVLLSFSHFGKSFRTLDTAIFYPATDTGGPKMGNEQDNLLKVSDLDDIARKMESTGILNGDSDKKTYLMDGTVEDREDNNFPPTTMVASSPSTSERIAIVVRSKDPIRSAVQSRLIQMAEIFQKDDFTNYDFHIMIDQTKHNLTTTETLQRYFRAHNASHLKAPTVFSVSEQMILEEFPKLASGYVKGPLVDGGPGTCCAQPLMWQLLTPTFVTFVHYHQEYDYIWIFEDDLWSVGTPIVEVLHALDDKLRGKNASLCGSKLRTNGVPYTKMTKERHTYEFRDILIAMKATAWQRQNRTLLEMDGQIRSQFWNEWGANTLPVWSCMSDTLYRHSRDFGNYVYGMVKSNVYQFAECYQMPLAWYGGFQIADMKTILPDIEGFYKDGRRDEPGIHVKWEDVAYNRKLEIEQAEIRLQDYQTTTNVTSLIYHEVFVPSNGKEYRTQREHHNLCSLTFDFRQDSILTADCERTLGTAGLQEATGVIFIGNNPIFKLFHNFLAVEKATLLFQIMMDDNKSKKKNRDYYRYPPVNYDEWMKNTTHLTNEIIGKTPGTGKCNKDCHQTKLRWITTNLTMEALLVESSRDLFFPTLTTTTSQETVAKWISEHYQDRQNTVCIMQMDNLEMIWVPNRTKTEFLENTKVFLEMLKPSCGTIIRFGFLPHFSTRSVQEIVSWDEGLRDLVLDDSTLNGYFVDVSNAKKSNSNNRYSKPIWRMFVRLMGLPSAVFER